MATKILVPAFARKPDGRSRESRVSRQGKRVGEPLTWEDYMEQLAQAQITPTPVSVRSWAWDERLGRAVPVPPVAPPPSQPPPSGWAAQLGRLARRLPGAPVLEQFALGVEAAAPRQLGFRPEEARARGVGPAFTAGQVVAGLGGLFPPRTPEELAREPGWAQAMMAIPPAGWIKPALVGLPSLAEAGLAAQAARRGAGLAVGQVAPRVGLKVLGVPEVAGGMERVGFPRFRAGLPGYAGGKVGATERLRELRQVLARGGARPERVAEIQREIVQLEAFLAAPEPAPYLPLRARLPGARPAAPAGGLRVAEKAEQAKFTPEGKIVKVPFEQRLKPEYASSEFQIPLGIKAGEDLYVPAGLNRVEEMALNAAAKRNDLKIVRQLTRKGQGRLLEERIPYQANGMYEVSPDALSTNPLHQPRKALDEANIKRIVETYDSNRFLPIEVREIAPGRFEVIHGHHRLEAAKRLGLSRVPVRVLNVSDQEAIRLAEAANIAGKPLAPTELAGVLDRRVRLGEAPEAIVKAFPGASLRANQVEDYARIVNLPKVAKEALDDPVLGRQFTPAHAMELARAQWRYSMPLDEVQAFFNEVIMKGDLTPVQVRRLLDNFAPVIRAAQAAQPDMFGGIEMPTRYTGIMATIREAGADIKKLELLRRQLRSIDRFVEAGQAVPTDLVGARPAVQKQIQDIEGQLAQRRAEFAGRISRELAPAIPKAAVPPAARAPTARAEIEARAVYAERQAQKWGETAAAVEAQGRDSLHARMTVEAFSDEAAKLRASLKAAPARAAGVAPDVNQAVVQLQEVAAPILAARNRSIARVYLIGSRVRGEIGRDIDLLVELDKPSVGLQKEIAQLQKALPENVHITFGTRRPGLQAIDVTTARAAEPQIPPAVAEAAKPPTQAVPLLAAPPPMAPSKVILRLSIRSTQREGGGFLITGRDTKNRQVRVFAKTLGEAKQARDRLKQGLEPFIGTEAEAQVRALSKAERRYRAALKRGEPGVIERARTELEQVQARPTAGPPPTEPPKLPPKMMPNGTEVPPPEFEAARNKLVSLLQGAARKGSKEIEQARAAERARRFAISRTATEEALAAGRSPLPGIRAAQRGEMPIAELALPDRLTPEEVAVLRDRIYKTLGPELDWTSANIEESLTRLATEGKIPTGAEMAWMEEIFGPELIEALRSLRTRGAKIGEVLLEIWNLPRAVLASFDDSMVLRQGLHLLAEGTAAARALKAHVRALTKIGADGINATIRANPWFNHGRAHGLDMTLPGMGRGIGGREEVFFGAGLARKLPIVGKGVEISERIATAYLNKLRIETYAAHAEELTRMGAGYDAFRELAENINILSGRASLGRLQPIAPYVNGMFFSARLNWAAAQRPFRILRQIPQLGTPEGRHLAKMLARDVYGVWAAIGGMLGLGAAAGVIAVELDRRSSDFGKARIGSVRLDPWAGQQQLAVLVARIISGQTKATTTGEVRGIDPVQVLARFLESKFHPTLSQAVAARRGETYVGENLTVQQYARMWAPLFIQDILEIASSTSPGVAVPLGIAGFFGVSVYNIPTQPKTTGLQRSPWSLLEAQAGPARSGLWERLEAQAGAAR